MLYLLHMGNHPNLDYRGGQAPIVHLESDLHRAVEWAGDNGRRWGFSLSNAGAYGTEFRCELDQLDELDWDAIGARQWARVREAKQAEFLMEKSFPWELVERVGVHSAAVAQRVTAAFGQAHHRPLVQVMQDWYY